MPAPRKIPPKLEPEILRLRGEGQTAVETARWLKRLHGIDVTPRGVQKLLARIDEERAPIARAVTVQELTGKVTADLQGFDGIIRRAERDERASEKGDPELVDVEQKLSAVVNADIADYYAADGTFLPLDKIPEVKRRAVASLRIREDVEEKLTDDGAPMKKTTVRVVSLKLLDPIKAAPALVDIRERRVGRELALKAREQQLRARETRLEMAGAMPKNGEESEVRRRLIAKVTALTPGTPNAGSPSPIGGSAGGGPPKVH